jgi:hypothetical protein
MVRGPGGGNLSDIWTGCSIAVTLERFHHACQVPPSPKHRSFQKGKCEESTHSGRLCEGVPRSWLQNQLNYGIERARSEVHSHTGQCRKNESSPTDLKPAPSPWSLQWTARDPKSHYNSPSTRPPHRASTATSPSLQGSGFSKCLFQSTSEPLGLLSCVLSEQH